MYQHSDSDSDSGSSFCTASCYSKDFIVATAQYNSESDTVFNTMYIHPSVEPYKEDTINKVADWIECIFQDYLQEQMYNSKIIISTDTFSTALPTVTLSIDNIGSTAVRIGISNLGDIDMILSNNMVRKDTILSILSCIIYVMHKAILSNNDLPKVDESKNILSIINSTVLDLI